MSNQHPLADRTSIRLEELKEDVFITTKMVNSAAYHYMLRLCKISGFQPKKMLNVDYLMRSKLLEKNSGIAIATELGWKMATVHSENVIAIPLSSPILPRTQAVSWKKSHILSKPECDFIQHLKEFIQTHHEIFTS